MLSFTHSPQIRVALDEWKTGTFQVVSFTSEIYKPVYEILLANLLRLGEEDPQFTDGLGHELWEDCM